jgi:hypothetical protein
MYYKYFLELNCLSCSTGDMIRDSNIHVGFRPDDRVVRTLCCLPGGQGVAS